MADISVQKNGLQNSLTLFNKLLSEENDICVPNGRLGIYIQSKLELWGWQMNVGIVDMFQIVAEILKEINLGPFLSTDP